MTPSPPPGDPGLPDATPRAALPEPTLADAPSHSQDVWRRTRLWQIQPVRDVLVIALVLAVIYLGYLLRPVTVPLLLALALAYLVEPVVSRATSSGRLSRPFVAACLIVALTLTVVTPIVVGSGFAVAQGARAADAVAVNLTRLNNSVRNPDDERIREAVPRGVWRSTRDFLVDLRRRHPELAAADTTLPPADAASVRLPDSLRDPTTAERWADFAYDWLQSNMPAVQRWFSTSLIGSGRDAFTALWGILLSAFYLAFTLFLTLFFFFFVCSAWGRVKEHIVSLVPDRTLDRFIHVVSQMDRVIAAFVRGRLIISAILIVEFSLGYWLIGVPVPLIMGLAVGVLSIVPYLALVGVPVSILLMWLNPPAIEWQTAWWWVVLAPIALYWVCQATDDYIWTPMIQGKATGMDTPTILFAVMAGATLAGIYGVMVAIPTAACVKILLKEIFWPRFQAWAKGQSRDFLPISRA